VFGFRLIAILCAALAMTSAVVALWKMPSETALSRLSPPYERPLRIKSASPNISRSLSRARLIAGWLKKQRFDARVTCRSSKSAWRARSKFKWCEECRPSSLYTLPARFARLGSGLPL
jgi:hypothetical protein